MPADAGATPDEATDAVPDANATGLEAEATPVLDAAIPGDTDIVPAGGLVLEAAASDEGFRPPRRIVGVGGSAGAFEAASTVLQEIYPGSEIAIIIVQHLDPGHPSQLASLLSRQTTMKVVEAEQGMRIEADTVYVIPASQAMTVEGGRLRLNPRGAEVGHQWIIDAFLHSLALDVGPAAIGVLLSGTLSDGAEGMAAIHRAGGATLVQSRESAKFPDMPNAALRLGVVDLEVPVEELAKEITKLAADDVPFERPAEATAMDRVRSRVRSLTGMDLRDYKLPTVTRRLQRRMDAMKVAGLVEYADLIEDDEAEIQALHDDMLIAVTRFFRDSDVFDAIRATAIPEIVASKKDGDTVRVWVPGCCTGQEAYSLAMLFDDAISQSGKRIDLQVFGTDRSSHAVALARQGTYSAEVRGEVPKQYFDRYMIEEDGTIRVRKSLRGQCIFAEHDLLHDPPFSAIDMASCRNVLIYLDGPAQARTMDAIHFGLRSGGWLVLGGSESGLRADTRFAQVDGRQPLYRRAGGGSRLPPRLRHIAMSGDSIPVVRTSTGTQAITPVKEANPWDGTPDALIVDDKFDILMDVPGLHHPKQHNVLRVTRGALADAIRGIVPEALRKQRAQRVRIDHDGSPLDLLAMPLDEGHGRRVVLLMGRERLSVPLAGGRKVVDLLASHLDALNKHVQTLVVGYEGTLEELSCAHEESMSANEELQSGNEELMTANEEAQSAAEELRTLNDEMARRQQEAQAALDDIEAILEAEANPLMIVESNGRIRRINSDARVMFNLTDGDGTGYIDDAQVPFRNLDLHAIIKEVAAGKRARHLDAVHVDGGMYRISIIRAVGRAGLGDAAVVRVVAHSE